MQKWHTVCRQCCQSSLLSSHKIIKPDCSFQCSLWRLKREQLLAARHRSGRVLERNYESIAFTADHVVLFAPSFPIFLPLSKKKWRRKDESCVRICKAVSEKMCRGEACLPFKSPKESVLQVATILALWPLCQPELSCALRVSKFLIYIYIVCISWHIIGSEILEMCT